MVPESIRMPNQKQSTMKKTIITTAAAGMAAFGLTTLPVAAQAPSAPPANPEKPAAADAAADTVTAYIVQVSGKG